MDEDKLLEEAWKKEARKLVAETEETVQKARESYTAIYTSKNSAPGDFDHQYIREVFANPFDIK